MEPPFRVRQFVRCQFPYMEEPLRPGPDEHAGYIADIRRIDGKAHLTVMSLYTTTTPWEPGVPLPLGLLPVEPAMAREMNQKGLVMDARKIAFIPVTQDFFPRLGEPERGVIHTASVRFHQLVQNTLMNQAKRPEVVVRWGRIFPARLGVKRHRPRDEDAVRCCAAHTPRRDCNTTCNTERPPRCTVSWRMLDQPYS
jgi:hypothetical protein